MAALDRLFSDILYLLPAILISLTVHECCHALAAYSLGDPTAKNAGRLTLSPLSHLDPMGTLCLLFFRFGWAKPVPVNPMYFRNRKRDMALTAAAGPASNLVLGFFSLMIYFVLMYSSRGGGVSGALLQFFYMLTSINVGLAVFNLLPISPLDGSKILFGLLPDRLYFKMLSYERFMQPLVFVLLMLGLLSRPLSYLQMQVINAMYFLLRPLLRVLFG